MSLSNFVHRRNFVLSQVAKALGEMAKTSISSSSEYVEYEVSQALKVRVQGPIMSSVRVTNLCSGVPGNGVN